MTKWKLKRVRQCLKCPWKVATNPHEIPNGYTVEKHRKLSCTIAEDGNLAELGIKMNVMACHELHEAHCIGWLMNQLGQGNNIPLRIKMISCENGSSIKLDGPQHACFEDTLP